MTTKTATTTKTTTSTATTKTTTITTTAATTTTITHHPPLPPPPPQFDDATYQSQLGCSSLCLPGLQPTWVVRSGTCGTGPARTAAWEAASGGPAIPRHVPHRYLGHPATREPARRIWTPVACVQLGVAGRCGGCWTKEALYVWRLRDGVCPVVVAHVLHPSEGHLLCLRFLVAMALCRARCGGGGAVRCIRAAAMSLQSAQEAPDVTSSPRSAVVASWWSLVYSECSAKPGVVGEGVRAHGYVVLVQFVILWWQDCVMVMRLPSVSADCPPTASLLRVEQCSVKMSCDHVENVRFPALGIIRINTSLNQQNS